SIDYRKKTVTLDIAKSRDNVRVINKVKAIANKHGHHFIVKEKRLENKTIKTFFVENLDCANCAAKIAQKVGSLEEITNAICDFLAKKLVIEIEDDSKLDEIIRQTESAVKTVEPDVKLVDWDEKQESEEKHKESLLKDYLCFGIGSVFFVLGLVLYLSPWWELTFFVVSYLFVGSEVLIKALKNIIRGRIFDENLLMTIATIGAFLIGDFGEGVAVMIFYQVGELLQGIAVERSRKSISKLMDIRPEYAYLQTPEGIKKVKPTEVNVGDKIIVKPGDRIPLDGTVLEGNSFVDTAALTGESVLREVQTGAGVHSGFINKNGLLTIEVTKNYGDSAVSVILNLVENASSKKTPTENFITKVARFYTPAVVFLALMIAFLPLIFVEGATLGEWGHRALVFLVISCPCALVISIPLGFFGGIGGASR
ncbi:MAG TPA: heavy metal translocating P-type ATPase, partial [Bacilli bacterium]|nr:heavy metal translocating P-type ATPase [Bacilli bacterium]